MLSQYKAASRKLHAAADARSARAMATCCSALLDMMSRSRRVRKNASALGLECSVPSGDHTFANANLVVIDTGASWNASRARDLIGPIVRALERLSAESCIAIVFADLDAPDARTAVGSAASALRDRMRDHTAILDRDGLYLFNASPTIDLGRLVEELGNSLMRRGSGWAPVRATYSIHALATDYKDYKEPIDEFDASKPPGCCCCCSPVGYSMMATPRGGGDSCVIPCMLFMLEAS